eukprot:366086-Chlamydomonas_euryale.AAC.16
MPQLCVPAVDTCRRAGHHADGRGHVHHLRLRLEPSERPAGGRTNHPSVRPSSRLAGHLPAHASMNPYIRL